MSRSHDHYLENLRHKSQRLAQELEDLKSLRDKVRRLEAGKVFYLRRLSAEGTPALCVRESLTAPERVLVDPRARAAIDWYSPSPDGRHVAYGVSVDGSEDSVLHVLSVANGKDDPEDLYRVDQVVAGDKTSPSVEETGCSVQWPA